MSRRLTIALHSRNRAHIVVRKTRHYHLRTPPRSSPAVNSVRKRLIRVVALCAILAALAPLPVSAARAAQPTTDHGRLLGALLNDSYDGTISNIYPIPCYREAISHLPPDAADLRQRQGRHHRGRRQAASSRSLGKLRRRETATLVAAASSQLDARARDLTRLPRPASSRATRTRSPRRS